MQDDTLIGNLTVRETLRYAFKLRVPERNAEKREKRIETMIDDLNLRKVADSRVGTPLKRGISGGERRRLAIGIEIVTSPKLIFLDEPTTGLDSHNALRVMLSLKRLCEKHQVTMVCTVHQPRSNIFQLFDNLLLLLDGRTVYFGEAHKSIEYFDRNCALTCPTYMNPADYFLDVLVGETEEQVFLPSTRSPSLLANDHPSPDQEAEEERPFDKAQLPEIFVQSTAFDDLQNALRLQLELSKRGNFKSLDTAAFLENGMINSSGDSSSTSFPRRSDESFLDIGDEMAVYPRNGGKKAHCSSTDGDDLIEDIPAPEISLMTQMSVLMARTWKDNIRDPNIVYVRTFAAVSISFLMGLVYFQSDNVGNHSNAIIFLMTCFSLFALPSISKYIDEKLLYSREHASRCYGTLPYLLSHYIVELPILVFTVVVYASISYFMVGFRPGIQYFLFYVGVEWLVISIGYSACQVIASFSNSLNVSIAVYVLYMLYSLLTGGFLVSKSDLPSFLGWMINTSYFYYGFAALEISQFNCEGEKFPPCSQSWVNDIGLQGVSEWECAGALVLFWLAFQVIEYFSLRFFNKEKR